MAPTRGRSDWRRSIALATHRRRQQQAIAFVFTAASIWYRLQIRRRCRYLERIRRCINTRYVPTGKAIACHDRMRGSVWIQSILEGHPQQIYDITRLQKEQFLELLAWLRRRGLRNSRRCTATEKLAIFLCITRHGHSFRLVRELFNHSLQTISRAFHQILNIVSTALYREVVRLPPNTVPNSIREKSYHSYFEDCRGAVDGTHIPISVPESNQTPWRNRKGCTTQNVFACADFDMNFCWVLAGWEGSVHNGRVIRHAITKGFRAVAPGTYYLADADYSTHGGLLLTPYRNVRYHLEEWDRGGDPENAEELFNLRHSTLRNVVKRAIGCIKHRFNILTQPRRGFSVRTQCKVVYACVALHNWLNSHGSDPEVDAAAAEGRNLIGDEGVPLVPEGHFADERRDTIAAEMFLKYCT